MAAGSVYTRCGQIMTDAIVMDCLAPVDLFLVSSVPAL